MTVFFTSDLHFGHENIIKYCNRPFTSVEEMNNEIVTRWNAKVNVDDTVYVLGDVAMGDRQENLKYVERLNGLKHLIAGNHDHCWGFHPKADNTKFHQRMIDLYMDAGFATIKDRDAMSISKNSLWAVLSHFPYVGDSGPVDRYKEARPSDTGSWLLCGHVHDVWRKKNKMINVGVDAWNFYPVSEYQIDFVIRSNRNVDLSILPPTRISINV